MRPLSRSHQEIPTCWRSIEEPAASAKLQRQRYDDQSLAPKRGRDEAARNAAPRPPCRTAPRPPPLRRAHLCSPRLKNPLVNALAKANGGVLVQQLRRPNCRCARLNQAPRLARRAP